MQPTIARANGIGIGIARHAPNPNAALPFYEYILSAAGAQKTLASLGYVPTSSGLSSPVPNLTIKLVDPVVMMDQVEKWNKSFQEIFVKRSGQ
jgi:iron(III) transport system substrate-binding protein